MKKGLLLVAALIGGFIFCGSPVFAYDAPIYEHGDPITIHVDGNYLPCDVEPVIQNGRTLIPMRAAGEALGAYVAWDGSNRCITVAKDDKLIYFFAGSKDYYINDKTYHTDVAPTIIDDRTMLPLRVFAEALGTRVDWNQYYKDVSISTTGKTYSLPQVSVDETTEVTRWLQKYYSNTSNGILGNWTITKSESMMNGNVTTYNFFYPVQTGYQNIRITVENYSPDPLPTITIEKNNAWQTDSGYRHGNCENILYYRGGARGWPGYSETEYQMIGGNLIKTGRIDYDVMGQYPPYHQSSYDVYHRF